jgi:cytochrome c553
MTGPHFIIAVAILCVLRIAPATAAGLTDAPPGALSCSGCHATSTSVKTDVPRLIGREPAAIVSAMQGFRAGTTPATVMDRITKGFSDDEIKAIAAWYGTQQN